VKTRADKAASFSMPASPTSRPPTTREAARSALGRHVWDIAAVRDVFWIGSAAFLLWFGYELRGVFTPVLIALLLAYLVNPLVGTAERRWGVPRPVTITALLIAMAIVGAALAAWLGPIVSEQVQTLAKKTPQYLQRATQTYGVQVGTLSEQFNTLLTRLQDDPLSVLQPLFLGTSQAFGVIGQVIGTTTEVALIIVLIPIYFFFFSWHFDGMVETVGRFLPVRRKARILTIIGRMDQAVSGFFRGRLVIAVITGVLFGVGWAMTGVPYWFLLGVVTGVLNIIPYASAVGWPLAIALKYLDAVTGSGGSVDWLSIALWPSLPYLIVQFVDGWLLTPWIQSQSTDMSAVTVLIVVFIGGAIAGFYGLLLAIPAAACVKILLEEVVMPRWERWAAEH
jgi:predicted PurR-regulated permease PerM